MASWLVFTPGSDKAHAVTLVLEGRAIVLPTVLHALVFAGWQSGSSGGVNLEGWLETAPAAGVQTEGIYRTGTAIPGI